MFPPKRSKSGHITLTAVEKPFRKARKETKVPEDLFRYSARHSFATDLPDRTGNIKLIRMCSGTGALRSQARTCILR